MSGYECALGIHQEFDEPCPRCGATEETEGGCLGALAAAHAPEPPSHEGAVQLADKLRKIADPESRGYARHASLIPVLALADEVEQEVSALIHDLASTYDELTRYVNAPEPAQDQPDAHADKLRSDKDRAKSSPGSASGPPPPRPDAGMPGILESIDEVLGEDADKDALRYALMRARDRIAEQAGILAYLKLWEGTDQVLAVRERIAELEAALAALDARDKDAERYRWLRKAIMDKRWEVTAWSTVSNQWLWCDDRRLDERIDAAQQPGEGGR